VAGPGERADLRSLHLLIEAYLGGGLIGHDNPVGALAAIGNVDLAWLFEEAAASPSPLVRRDAVEALRRMRSRGSAPLPLDRPWAIRTLSPARMLRALWLRSATRPPSAR
jgi:hypothetical protein